MTRHFFFNKEIQRKNCLSNKLDFETYLFLCSRTILSLGTLIRLATSIFRLFTEVFEGKTISMRPPVVGCT